MELTEEQKENLSAEELAALEDDGEKGGGEDGNTGDTADGDSDADTGDAKTAEVLKAEAEEAARQKADEEAKAAEDAKKAEEKNDEPPVAAAVIPPFQLQSGTGKTVEEITAELKALDEQLEEGDIALQEYNAKRDGLNKVLFRQEMYEDINKQVATQVVETRWKQAQQDFYTENKTYRDNSALNAAFVHVVNGLLASEEGKKMTDMALLKKAKSNVEESLGIGKKEDPPKKDDDGKAALETAKKKEAEKKSGPSLKDMPKAQEADFGDKFDALDKLSGEAFEEAVAKLTDAECRAYARRG